MLLLRPKKKKWNMILVSINTKNNYCVIKVIHKLMTIYLTKQFNKTKHVNPFIFISILKGTFILSKKILIKNYLAIQNKLFL